MRVENVLGLSMYLYSCCPTDTNHGPLDWMKILTMPYGLARWHEGLLRWTVVGWLSTAVNVGLVES